jgi:hypothetical protein
MKCLSKEILAELLQQVEADLQQKEQEQPNQHTLK